MLPESDPRREKFARLTASEEKWGLYDQANRIGTRNGWEEVLAEKGVGLRGHRVIRKGGPSTSVSEPELIGQGDIG